MSSTDWNTGLDRSVAMFALTLALAASLLAQPLLAQNASQPLWTRDSLRSSILGETRFLRISLPAFYGAPYNAPERFPVLIVLDAGGLAFTANIATARTLAEGTGAPAMPPLIIVGVETLTPSRYRDMTPPPVTAVLLSGDSPAPGGAPAFLRFLAEELRPFIAARYRTQSTTILAGHSLSGSFAMWAFGHAPEFLAGAIALSPTPGWLLDDSLAGRQVVDAIAARTIPGRVFLATGTAERYVGAGAKSFATLLNTRKNPKVVLDYQQILDAGHPHTQGPRGMMPALQFIFRPVSLSGFKLEHEDGEDRLSKFSAAFDSTRSVFLRGARELGLEGRLPLNFLSLQARGFADTTLAPLQLRFCEEIATSYPTLWNGYDCAGDALARMNRAAEATARYQRGAEAARSVGDSATADRLMRKGNRRSNAPAGR